MDENLQNQNNNIVIDNNTIIDATPNCKTVKVLKHLYASNKSELNLLHTYLFQSFVTKDINSQLFNTFTEFYLSSLNNLKLLADAIISFGGIPKFTNSQGLYFSTKFINYTTNTQRMLNNDIVLLKDIIKSYKNAIKCVNNQSLKNLLNNILESHNNQLKILESISV